MNQQAADIVYLNGSFLKRAEAALSLEDRGAMFADGVYELVSFFAGRPLAIHAHHQRLKRSMQQILLDAPVDDLPDVSHQLLRQNGLTHARVYWQVTRGPAPRWHGFPQHASPTVFAIAYPQPPLPDNPEPHALRAILTEDQRWARCDIKSLMLRPNVLAKEKARRAGADEAILVRDGRVTEGTSTNVFILRDGILHTHPADQWILGGVTRNLVIDAAHTLGLEVEQHPFDTHALKSAEQVMLCGTSTHLAAVVEVDNQPIADRHIHPTTRQLHHALIQTIRSQCALTP